MIETGTVDFLEKRCSVWFCLFFWCPFVFCFVFFSLFDLSMWVYFWFVFVVLSKILDFSFLGGTTVPFIIQTMQSPENLYRSPKRDHFKRNLIFQPLIFREYVISGECFLVQMLTHHWTSSILHIVTETTDKKARNFTFFGQFHAPTHLFELDHFFCLGQFQHV